MQKKIYQDIAHLSRKHQRTPTAGDPQFRKKKACPGGQAFAHSWAVFSAVTEAPDLRW